MAIPVARSDISTTTCRCDSAGSCGIGANGAVVRFDRVKVSMPDCTAMDSGTCDAARHLLATAFVMTRVGEPDAGNLHVRFDEGERPRGRSLLDCQAEARLWDGWSVGVNIARTRATRRGS